jgi:hypothetical protein
MEGVRDAFEAIVASGGRIAHATDCKGPLQHYPIAANVYDFLQPWRAATTSSMASPIHFSSISL